MFLGIKNSCSATETRAGFLLGDTVFQKKYMSTVAGQFILAPFTPPLWDPLLRPDVSPPVYPGLEQDLRPNESII